MLTLKGGPGPGGGGPAALHEAQEPRAGLGSTAWHAPQVGTHPFHHLHHDLEDVVLS